MSDKLVTYIVSDRNNEIYKYSIKYIESEEVARIQLIDTLDTYPLLLKTTEKKKHELYVTDYKHLLENLQIEEFIQLYAKPNKFFTKKMLASLYLYFNDLSDDEIEYLDTKLKGVIVKNLLENKDEIMKGLQRGKEGIALKIKNEKSMTSFISDIKELPYSNPDVKAVVYTNTFNTPVDLTITEFFNHIQLTEFIPYANLAIGEENDLNEPDIYTKMLEGKIYDPTWQEYKLNSIKLKVLITSEGKNQEWDDIYIDKTDKGYQVTYSVNKFLKKYISEDMLEFRLLNIFKSKKNRKIGFKKNREEKGIKIEFYIPNTHVNTYLLQDMIMNGVQVRERGIVNIKNMFYMFISDESNKPTKGISKYEKGNSGVGEENCSTNLHFYHSSVGSVSLRIKTYVASGTESELMSARRYLKKMAPNSFAKGTRYVRFRVSKIDDMYGVKILQLLLAKLVSLYLIHEQSVGSVYKNVIPKFVVDKIGVQNPERNLKITSIVPGLDIKNNTCPNNRAPKIIEADSVEEIEAHILEDNPSYNNLSEEDRNDMIKSRYNNFPEGSEYYFYCNKKDKKGNVASPCASWVSSGDVKIPCCVKMSKKDGRPSCVKSIVSRDNIGIKNIVSGNMILSEGGLGKINSSDVIQLIDPQLSGHWYRYGVEDTSFAFLECLNIVFDKNLDSDKLRLCIPLCLQNMFFLSEDDVADHIEDGKILDSRYFIQMLEMIFKTNIIVLTKDGIEIPSFNKGYYRDRLPERYVLIYKHFGGTADARKYPHYELIVYSKKKNGQPEKMLFSPKDIPTLIKYYNQRMIVYIDSEIPQRTVFIKADYQSIDEYGKCRKVFYNGVIIHTTPIMPRNCDIKKLADETYEFDFVANRLKNMVREKIFTVHTFGGKAVYVNFTIGTVKCKVMLRGALSQIHGITIIETDENVNILSKTSRSYMEKYSRLKKLARYISEATLWQFSRFIVGREDRINDNEISKFSNLIVVRDKYEYLPSRNKYELNNFVEGNKIIVNNVELKKRLIYYLKMMLHRNVDKVLKMKDLVYIQSYYHDISDFDQYRGQIVMKGKNAIEEANMELSSNVITNIPRISNRPYFFKHIKLGKTKNFIAHSSPEKSISLNYCINWTKSNGKNIFDPFMTPKDDNYIIFDRELNIIENKGTGKHLLIKVRDQYIALLEITKF